MFRPNFVYDIVWVYNCSFFGLICPVKNLKNISANQLIVLIGGNNYRISGTVIDNRIKIIGDGCDPFAIGNQSIVLFIDLMVHEIFLIHLYSSIYWGIIDEDNFVICIILSEYWVQIGFYNVPFIIVDATHYHTYRLFCFDAR